MGRPSSITPEIREKILNGWAELKKGPEIAELVGRCPRTVHNVITRARRDGDLRAAHRNPGAARRPEPVQYRSSRTYLDAALERARRMQAVWERSEMGRRMAEIAVPPPNER